MRFIEISYPINSNIAIYPGNPEFKLERELSIEKGDSTNVSLIRIGSHTGTHIDAPNHIFTDGPSLDLIPLERMNGRAKVFDVSGYKEINYTILKDFNIELDDIVLFRTDNSLKWSCDGVLDDYVTLTYESADYLAEKRIKMIGIDYMTIERPRAKREIGKSIHKKLLSNNVLILESLNLKNICIGEYELFCLPPLIEGLDGCTVRVVLQQTVDEC